MTQEEDISELKDTFAKRLSHAKLVVSHRKDKLYFRTEGCYKVEGWQIIELYFPDIILIKCDYSKLNYSYRYAP